MDSLHFQNKLIEMQYESITNQYKFIDNRMYCDYYKLFGLGSGITFLIMPILWESFEYISPLFNSLSVEIQNLLLLSFIIILLFIIDLIYNYIHRKNIVLTPKTFVPQDYQNAYTHVENKIINTKTGL